MLRVLILDDEGIIVDAVSQVLGEIDAGQPFEIEKAYSASQALGIFNRLRIDLLISDIRMPQMTGIELLKQVRAEWPLCRAILMTAFPEQEYMYETAQMGNVFLILKSDGFDKLRNFVTDVLKEIIEDKQTAERMRYLEENSTHYRKMMRRQILMYMLDNQKQTHRQMMQNFSFSIENKECLICSVRLDDQSDKPFLFQYEELDIKISALCGNDIVFESCLLQNGYAAYLFQYLYIGRTKSFIEKIRQILEFLVDSVETALSFYFALAENIFDVYKTYRYLLLKQSEVSGSGFVIYSEITVEEKEAYCIFNIAFADVEKIPMLLEREHHQEFISLLKQINKILSAQDDKNNPEAIRLYLTAALNLSRVLSERNLWDQVTTDIPLHALMNISMFKSWHDAGAYLIRLGESILRHISQNADKLQKRQTWKIKQYIDENLKDGISLTKISDEFHFNPSYLSRMFKQLEGENISDYIMKKKIETATELLKNPKHKISEIASMLGLNSPGYFTKIFKEYIGMTPQKYREWYTKL